MSHLPMEETDLFRVFDALSNEAWDLMLGWPAIAQDILGKQFVRAIDSVGANLVEGDGRYSDAEALHFFEFARGSAREAAFWIRKAVQRSLIVPQQADQMLKRIESGQKMLNSLINYRRRTKNKGIVRETVSSYRLGTLSHLAPSASRLAPGASFQISHGGDL